MKRLRWQAEWAWLASVVLLLVLGFWWFPGQTSDATDTFSTAAGGKRAFFTLAERLTPPATRTVEKFWDHVGDADTMCILGPARYPDADEWDWLTDWVSFGKTLVFAARQDDPAVDLMYFGVRVVPDERLIDKRSDKKNEAAESPSDSASDSDASESKNEDGNKEETKTDKVKTAEPRPRSIFREPAVQTPLATGKFHWQSAGHIETGSERGEVLVTVDGEPQVLRLPFGQGTLIVCSSDYVFTNKSLASDDNGLLAFRILEAGNPHAVVFDESLNASGAPKVFGLLFDPLVRPITLQILLVTVLFCWLGFRRFGAPAVQLRAEHRSMTEHAIALGNLHLKAGTGARAIHWYLDYFRNELRLHYAANSGVAEATLLARRTGTDEQATAKLLADVRDALAQDRLAGGRAATLIRELAAIKHKLDWAKGASNGT